MARAVKHPNDKGKYQSTFDNYGHGKGNGKSRAAVYKHHKKFMETTSQNVEESPLIENITSQNVEESKEIENNSSQNVEEINSDWEDIEWLNESDEDGLPSPTIPTPIRKLSEGGAALSVAQRATQGKLVRWAYMGIDRGLTHWGRGVTQQPNWEIKRHPMDYDALEGATMHMMDANGISINLSPNLVFMTVVGSAYIPPVSYVAKNSKKSFLPKLNFKSIMRNPFRRKKKQIDKVSVEHGFKN
tara:strand:+ start:4273 stop:5004 length:732 start_codon:yes stop_codon:yes gene_type:complete